MQISLCQHFLTKMQNASQACQQTPQTKRQCVHSSALCDVTKWTGSVHTRFGDEHAVFLHFQQNLLLYCCNSTNFAQICLHGMLRLTIMCLGDLTPTQHSESHDSASHSGSCNANYIQLHPLLHNPAYFYRSAVSSGICLVFASFQMWRRYNTSSV